MLNSFICSLSHSSFVRSLIHSLTHSRKQVCAETCKTYFKQHAQKAQKKTILERKEDCTLRHFTKIHNSQIVSATFQNAFHSRKNHFPFNPLKKLNNTTTNEHNRRSHFSAFQKTYISHIVLSNFAKYISFANIQGKLLS